MMGTKIDGVLYVSSSEYAETHTLKRADVSRACSRGVIPNARKPFGNRWVLPVGTDVKFITTSNGRKRGTTYRIAVTVPIGDVGALTAVVDAHKTWSMVNTTTRATARRAKKSTAIANAITDFRDAVVVRVDAQTGVVTK